MTHYSPQYVTDIQTKKTVQAKTALLTGESDSDFDTDDVLATTIADTDFGLLLVKETTANTGALYLLSGTAIELISGNTLVWTSTKNTASKYNVYIEDNVVKVQNKVGDNKDITIGIYKI